MDYQQLGTALQGVKDICISDNTTELAKQLNMNHQFAVSSAIVAEAAKSFSPLNKAFEMNLEHTEEAAKYAAWDSWGLMTGYYNARALARSEISLHVQQATDNVEDTLGATLKSIHLLARETKDEDLYFFRHEDMIRDAGAEYVDFVEEEAKRLLQKNDII